MDEERMRQRISRVRLSLCCSLVCLTIFGCTSSRPQRVSVMSPVAPAAPKKTKIIVLRFENAVKDAQTNTSVGEDRLFGNGIKAQIVDALERSGRFTVQTNAGPREVLPRDSLTETGEIREPIRERLGSLGDAKFLIAGVMITYQLSKKSKKAGINADLFFRQAQARAVKVDGIVNIAEKAFEKLKPVGQDHIGFEVWLFNAKTGKRLATTRIEGTPSDSDETLTTPMQQSVQGSAVKAVRWIIGIETAFRAGTLAPQSAMSETKKTPSLAGETEKITKSRADQQRGSVVQPRSAMKEQAKPGEEPPPVPATNTSEVHGGDLSGGGLSKPAVSPGRTLPQEEWGEK